MFADVYFWCILYSSTYVKENIFHYTQIDSLAFSYSIVFLFIIKRYGKSVLHSSSICACWIERYKNASRRRTTIIRSTRLHFKKQEKALVEAKKNKKSLHVAKPKAKDGISPMKLNKENTLILESCSQRPICVATRKLLGSIGIVTRFESQTNGMIGSLTSF